MPRDTANILRDMLGNQAMQIAELTAKVEALEAELATMTSRTNEAMPPPLPFTLVGPQTGTES